MLKLQQNLGVLTLSEVMASCMKSLLCSDTQQLMAGGINGRCAMLEADSW